MEASIRLTQEQINYVCEAANESFTRAVIEKGWELYYKKAVGEAEWAASTFKTRVRDGDLYEVQLDCDFFTISECGCGRSYCAHMAAAFLQLYAQQGGRPEMFLKQFIQNEMTKPVPLPGSKARSAPYAMPAAMPTPKSVRERQEKERRAKSAKPHLGPESSVEQWHDYFGKLFASFNSKLKQHFDVYFAQLLEQAGEVAGFWPKPLADLYRIHMLLDFAARVEEDYRKNASSLHAYFFLNRLYGVAGQIRERVISIVSKADRLAIHQQYASHLEETARRLHDFMCSNPRSAMNWVFLYRYLWWNLLHLPPLLDKETVRLERRLKESGASPERLDAARLGAMHLRFMQGQEEEAFTIFARDMADKEAGCLFIYLQYYLQTKQWNKLLHGLKWMIPYVKADATEALEPYLQYWEAFVKETGDRAPLSDALRLLLPYTYEAYSDQLMKTRQFRMWVDLQLAMAVDPDDLEASDLRKVTAAQGSLLLPLYHQSIERHIEQKNRESYKTAVSYLGTLRDCYYKLKAPQQWNAYIAYLKDKYSRLRALQEELKKGKLIS